MRERLVYAAALAATVMLSAALARAEAPPLQEDEFASPTPGVYRPNTVPDSLTTSSLNLGTVSLRWTTPGDDSLSGVATQYDLRYWNKPITAANFNQAWRLPMWGPNSSGKIENITVLGAGMVPGWNYYFAIKTADEAGNWSGISNVVVKTASTASLARLGKEPIVGARASVGFSSPWPNPSRSIANFDMALSQAGPVQVEAFDISGRRVRTLASGWHEAGATRLIWDLRGDDGNHVAAGIYLVRASMGGLYFTRRVVVSG